MCVRHQSVASCHRGPSLQPSMCPDWESNWPPFGLWDDTQTTEQPRQGYATEYHSVIKKKEILSFVTSWMILEDIRLSEIRQKMANIVYHLYVISKKPNSYKKRVEQLPRPGGGGNREMLLRGYDISALQDE